MKIIYIKKNSYAAAEAAYMHLKSDVSENFRNIVGSCCDEGHFYYLGIDAELNEIYLLYCNKCTIILKNLLESLSDLFNEEILVICSK